MAFSARYSGLVIEVVVKWNVEILGYVYRKCETKPVHSVIGMLNVSFSYYYKSSRINAYHTCFEFQVTQIFACSLHMGEL